MILGVGIDIIEVERVRVKIEKEQGFREMVFGIQEIEYCELKTHKFQHYAARFAAKEAFFKALGTGWAKGTSFNEIQILNDESGKPGIYLEGETASTLAHIKPRDLKISLTHIKETALAIIIIEA
ncbi:MAG: holo-[acyl-carrier-protein] synthase [Niabella sp.]|nr:MAG: holo-[acyl-carrier-protein] synthase [Niabella sp.]